MLINEFMYPCTLVLYISEEEKNSSPNALTMYLSLHGLNAFLPASFLAFYSYMYVSVLLNHHFQLPKYVLLIPIFSNFFLYLDLFPFYL